MRSHRIGCTSVIAPMTIALVMVTGEALFAQTGWEVVKTFHIGGQGGWDYRSRLISILVMEKSISRSVWMQRPIGSICRRRNSRS